MRKLAVLVPWKAKRSVHFASVTLIVAAIQVSLISLSSAQMSSTPTAKEVQALVERVKELGQGGRYAEAISLQQKLLAIFEKRLGPNNPNVAAALGNLAMLYRDQGR